ncbi:MAG: hypothetical protein E4H11_04535 [Myxococcales bacterium]|nr:MAG: hypothetical protein E4H11_04535 [Myxococcales bacterium]
MARSGSFPSRRPARASPRARRHRQRGAPPACSAASRGAPDSSGPRAQHPSRASRAAERGARPPAPRWAEASATPRPRARSRAPPGALAPSRRRIGAPARTPRSAPGADGFRSRLARTASARRLRPRRSRGRSRRSSRASPIPRSRPVRSGRSSPGCRCGARSRGSPRSGSALPRARGRSGRACPDCRGPTASTSRSSGRRPDGPGPRATRTARSRPRESASDSGTPPRGRAASPVRPPRRPGAAPRRAPRRRPPTRRRDALPCRATPILRRGYHAGARVDRFIVGTGRCGSTLLSRMLAECPLVLSVFEYFNGMDRTRRFAPEPVSGADFAALVCAEQPFLTAVMRRGYEVPEVIYPFGPGMRYRTGDALPWILANTLPRVSDRPDELYDESVAFLRRRPAAPALAHHRAFFAWLAARTGRRLWIERSGSSIDYLGALVDAFPEARFLHLHRDGPEAALSMREHHAYRLPISLLYDVPLDDGRRVSELGPLDLHAEPGPNDTVSRILASRPPAEFFGRYWSDQLARGYEMVPRIPSERWCEVRFEDLVSNPRAALETVRDFFALGPDRNGWIPRATALVRGSPAPRLDELPLAEQQALAAACSVGRKLLVRPR